MSEKTISVKKYCIEVSILKSSESTTVFLSPDTKSISYS